FGDLGLYDMRPATLFFDTVGASAAYKSGPLEVLLGFGDSGFQLRGLRYDAIPTGGAEARVTVADHLQLGIGGEMRRENGVSGNVNAPYQTPRTSYEDWVRAEVVQHYVD